MTTKQTRQKKYHAIHTRLSETEMEDFLERVATAGLSQSDYIRQSIFHNTIQVTITKECSLDQLEAILAQLGKIGSNLNQIARYFNTGGSATSGLEAELQEHCKSLEAAKYEILKIVGEAYGNHKTHRK